MRKLLRTTLLSILAFCAGRPTAQVVEHDRGPQTANYVSTLEAEVTPADGNWSLSLPAEGQTPVGNTTANCLKQFSSYYCQNTQDKVIYLTFDADHENGNTTTTPDALKKHNIPATFFLVSDYLETNPDLVRRMVTKGYAVGSHTPYHSDISGISTKEGFEKELDNLETPFQQITGQPMKRCYRLSQGKYSENSLKMASDMGYRTLFWSLVYTDRYENKQPSKKEAFKKLLGRIHPSAAALLHSTPKTNAQILDEFLIKWEKVGYHFGSLDDLVAAQ